ncbi:MAG: phosphotransferase family protein, partial [Acidimicrobiia bacterium]
MTHAAQRDLATMVPGLMRWLTERRGLDTVTVHGQRPTAGLSSETLMVDATGTIEDRDYSESLVVRLAPAGAGIFPEYDLALQARAQEAAAEHGIPAAVPVELELDPQWLGAPFLVMPVIEGHVGGELPIRDPWIMDAPERQREISRHLYDTLATLHRVNWRAAGLECVLPHRDLDAELAYWARFLEWYADGEVVAPALVEALRWCAAHRPADEPPHSLLWGDVRLGNVIFDDERRVVAVLDWEMTTIGPAEHDVAWHLALESMQNELFGRGVPGFLDRDALLARYAARNGRALDDLEWFEIFSLV